MFFQILPLLGTMYVKCPILVLVTLSQMVKLGDSRRHIIAPRIYRIIEKNNNIAVERVENANFDKQDLLKFLRKNSNLEYKLDNILNRQEMKRGMKKKWIKRIVPHNEETPSIAYERFGLSYRPFVRLHKTNNIFLENEKSIPELDNVQSELSDLKTKLNIENNKNSLKFDNTYIDDAEKVIRYIKEVDRVIRTLGPTYLRRNLHNIIKRYVKKMKLTVEHMEAEIQGYVMKETSEALRGGAPTIEEVVAKKAENNGHKIHNDTEDKPRITGIIENVHFSDEHVSELPSPLFPHQSLWNKWTYKQEIYEDVCPKGLVILGNICVKRPLD